MVLLRLSDFFCLLYRERFHAGILFLNAITEIARPVFKQHNKAKSQNDKQGEPKKPAHERHRKRLARARDAINGDGRDSALRCPDAAARRPYQGWQTDNVLNAIAKMPS